MKLYLVSLCYFMCIEDLCYFMSIATAKGHINDWKPARNRGKNLSFCVESKESLSGSFTVWTLVYGFICWLLLFGLSRPYCPA
jgi:hypothetical protein